MWLRRSWAIVLYSSLLYHILLSSTVVIMCSTAFYYVLLGSTDYTTFCFCYTTFYHIKYTMIQKEQPGKLKQSSEIPSPRESHNPFIANHDARFACRVSGLGLRD